MSQETGPIERPDPYVPEGDGWLMTVNLPGFGRWKRNPTQVSQTYTVYNQDGADFHITISSAFLNNHTAALGTHISSNAESALGRRAHWPLEEPPNAWQQDWLNAHDTGRFDEIIEAFSERLRRCAGNIKLSRAYDAEQGRRRREAFEAAKRSRLDKAGYEEELLAWVRSCHADDYRQGFQYKDKRYYPATGADALVELLPVPLDIMSKEKLSRGFVNMCSELTGVVETLEETHWALLEAGLVLLRVKDKAFAMRRADFDDCPSAAALMLKDQLVKRAVTAWTEAAAQAAVYDTIAFDGTLTNVCNTDGARFQVATEHLLTGPELAREGTTLCEPFIEELPRAEGLPTGVYELASVEALQAKLPSVVRVRRGKTDKYALKGKLDAGWTGELADATVDSALLAERLPKYRLFGEQLEVGGVFGMLIYLWRRGGTALLLGPKKDVAPEISVKKNGVLNASGSAIPGLFGAKGARMTAGAALTSERAIVIVDGDAQMLQPVLFVDQSKLEAFDYGQAKSAFAARMERAKAAQLAVEEGYKSAWAHIARKSGESDTVRIGLFRVQADNTLVWSSDSSVDGADEIDTILVEKTDRVKPVNRKKYTSRQLEFSCKSSDQQAMAWVGGLLAIAEKEPKPPGPRFWVLTQKR